VNEKENPYEVLEIERTADDRAIKKAYAKKMRAHPPETHPEQFKRIRAAYELLANKEARARFDGASKDYSEYGETLGRRLEDVDACLNDGKLELAEQIVSELLRDHADRQIVHYRHGLLLMKKQAWEEALVVFSNLAKKDPSHPTYRAYIAGISKQLGKKAEAEEAMRESFRLDPIPPRRIALAEMLAHCGKPTEASALLDEGLASAQPNSTEARELLLCKFGIVRFAGGNASDVVKRLIESRQGDDDLARYVSARMGETAASLFALKRFGEANEVMAQCQAVNPKSEAYRALLPKTTLRLHALPKQTQAWLASRTPGPTSATVSEVSRLWSLLAVMIGVGLLGCGMTFVALHMPGGVPLLLLGVMISGYALFNYLHIIASPVRGFVTVEAPYLVRARPRAVTVYPLYLLEEIKATHHHNNGVYTGTQIHLRFNGTKTTVALRNKSYAEGWLEFLGDQHRRTLEVLGEGFLEADPMVERFSAALLAAPQPKEARLPSVEALKANTNKRDVASLALAMAIPIAVSVAVFIAGSQATVWFVSGLDQTAEIEIAGRKISLAAHEKFEQSLPVGKTNLVVSVHGKQVSRSEVAIPPFKDAVLVNPLGAAPLVRRSVVYAAHQDASREVRPEVLAGNEFVVRDSVDYVLVDPPRSISSSRDSGAITKSHVLIAKQEDGGFRDALLLIANLVNPAEATALADRLLAAEPQSRTLARWAFREIVRSDGNSVAKASALYAKHPESAAMAALLTHVLVHAGAPLPQNVDRFRFMTALTERLPTSLTQLTALAKEEDIADYRIWLARAASASSDYHQCEVLLAGLGSEGDSDERALCLLELGQVDKAKSALSGESSAPEVGAQVLLAHLAVVNGSTPADELARLKAAVEAAHGPGRVVDYAASRFAQEQGLPSIVDEARQFEFPTPEDFARGPGAVRDAYRKFAHPEELSTPLVALVFGEALLSGDLAEARAVYDRSPGLIVPFESLVAFVLRGEDEARLWPLRIEARGVLALARARVLDQRGDPAAKVSFERARSLDPLGLWVRRAMRGWSTAHG